MNTEAKSPPTPDEVWLAANKIGEWMGECDFDHHGTCQAHFPADPPCPFGVLRAWARHNAKGASQR